MGPRSIRNQQRYLQQALKEREDEIQKSCRKEKNIYESTSFAAQKHASEQLLKVKARNETMNNTNKDKGNDEQNTNHDHGKGNTKNGHAITFWSHHLLTTSEEKEEQKVEENEETEISMIRIKRKSFAKRTSFTNDIHDGRLQHACN